MSLEPIEPGQLLEVLASIDQGTKRWRRKCQIIAVLGRWGDVHELGIRELSERTLVSHRLLGELLGELLEAGVLRVAYIGQGSRATAWVVDRNVQRWRGVPWLREPAAVALYAFHVEHDDYAEPGQRAQGEPRSARRPQRRAQGKPGSARRPQRRAQGEPGSARRESPARGVRAGARAQIAAAAQEGFPAGGTADDAAATRPGAGAGLDAGEWRQLRAAVIAAAAPMPGRAKFLNGPAELALSELALVAGCSELMGWLLEAPADLGVPRLVDWLQDRWHQPSAELLERLAARGAAEPPPAPPEAPRPALPEVRAPEPAELPERRPGAAAAAKAALRSTSPTPTTEDHQ